MLPRVSGEENLDGPNLRTRLRVCHDGLVAESFAGKLLIASPRLDDSNFHRTVVLLCMHDEAGAFGLVLNRPVADAEISSHLPQWCEHVPSPTVIFQGGPVEPAAALALGRQRLGAAQGVPKPVLDSIGLVDLGLPPEDLLPQIDLLRIFAGYAGWGAGQLEGELAEGSWFVVDPEPADVFSQDPPSLWRAVLRRQSGRLAMFAYFPADPSTN
jgi:putative transcriptional regulator